MILLGFVCGFATGYLWVVWLLAETYRDTAATYSEDGHVVHPHWSRSGP